MLPLTAVVLSAYFRPRYEDIWASIDVLQEAPVVYATHEDFDPSLHTLPDGIHPKEAGARVLSKSFLEAFEEAL